MWADTAYRSAKNETHLAAHGFTSRIHRKKPAGKTVPKRTARANAAKSEVRARIEHVLARQKGPMGLVIRTLGLARATVKIGLANLVYNMRRFVWLPTATSAGVDCDPKLRDPDRLTARSSQRHTNLPRNEDAKLINPAQAVLGQQRGSWRCPGSTAT